ncbi:hypothetical protein P7H17_27075 [Paenibacillus larvae]|nr:hypothetical protein [Paenibacillus larvae]MDT2288996.1 hypothetical protein [Paenibacillus larvae]
MEESTSAATMESEQRTKKDQLLVRRLRRHLYLAKPTKRMAGLMKKTGMEFLMRKAR